MLSRLDKRGILLAILHSLAFFLIAWLLFWFFKNLTTIIIANSLEIPTVWFYHRIDFMIPQAAWNADLVKLTFSGAPVLSLIISVLCLIAYYNVMDLNGILKLVFLWGFIHGWTGFFGSIFIGTLTNTGFGHVVIWLYLNDTARLTTNLISLFMLFLGGFFIAKPTLISANYYLNLLPQQARSRFLSAQLIIPAFAGLLLIAALRVPASLEDQLIPVTSLLVILPVFMRRNHFSVIYFDDELIEIRLEWIYVIIAIALTLAFRLIFEFGIRTGH
jgi:hypothetical protein